MAEKDIIALGANGLDFGDYSLASKTKKDGFSWNGDIYKVKTFNEITKLEKNGMFAYESEPGTNVKNFKETAEGVSFEVKGSATAQIIIGLAEDCDYDVYMDGVQIDRMKTNISGKLALNAELNGTSKTIKVVKC